MDAFESTTIEQEIRDAAIQADGEDARDTALLYDIPKLGTLAKHEGLCDREAAQAHELGKRGRRTLNCLGKTIER